jgi:uncharacterized damage-inducible protein DinB
MNRTRPIYLLSLAIILTAQPAWSQSTPTDYRDEFLQHFDRSSRKILDLARAVPEELYAWSPGEGVMSISQVYMHIARYNFYYPETALGVDAPGGIDVPNLETITDKAEVNALLRRSVDHVRVAATRMTANDLTEPTMLYGRRIAGWGVLFQLLAHMNEHVGQSVAYARMNGIVPPWSR